MEWVPVLAVVVTLLANLACWAGNHNSPLHSWFHLPCLYYSSNRKGVAIWRIVSVIFFLAASIVEGTTGDGFGDRPAEWITFFTNWTWLLFGIWTVLGTYITFCHLKEQGQHGAAAVQGASDHGARPPIRKRRRSEIAYSLIAQTTASSTLFLSAFFWLLLHRKGPVALDNALKHGINNIVLIVDILISRLQIVSYHFQVTLWYGTAYLLFMWIYHDASSHWVYDVLDWTKPWAIPLYLPLPLLLYMAFMSWFALATLREYLDSRSKTYEYQMQADSELAEVELQGSSHAMRG